MSVTLIPIETEKKRIYLLLKAELDKRSSVPEHSDRDVLKLVDSFLHAADWGVHEGISSPNTDVQTLASSYVNYCGSRALSARRGGRLSGVPGEFLSMIDEAFLGEIISGALAEIATIAGNAWTPFVMALLAAVVVWAARIAREHTKRGEGFLKDLRNHLRCIALVARDITDRVQVLNRNISDRRFFYKDQCIEAMPRVMNELGNGYRCVSTHLKDYSCFYLDPEQGDCLFGRVDREGYTIQDVFNGLEKCRVIEGSAKEGGYYYARS